MWTSDRNISTWRLTSNRLSRHLPYRSRDVGSFPIMAQLETFSDGSRTYYQEQPYRGAVYRSGHRRLAVFPRNFTGLKTSPISRDSGSRDPGIDSPTGHILAACYTYTLIIITFCIAYVSCFTYIFLPFTVNKVYHQFLFLIAVGGWGQRHAVTQDDTLSAGTTLTSIPSSQQTM